MNEKRKILNFRRKNQGIIPSGKFEGSETFPKKIFSFISFHLYLSSLSLDLLILSFIFTFIDCLFHLLSSLVLSSSLSSSLLSLSVFFLCLSLSLCVCLRVMLCCVVCGSACGVCGVVCGVSLWLWHAKNPRVCRRQDYQQALLPKQWCPPTDLGEDKAEPWDAL